MIKRSSGVLMHISSLPGPYSTGSLGREAREFAGKLKKAGCSYWQILPLNHPADGASPYSSRSLFALNPNYIDLDALADRGLLTRDELADAQLVPGQDERQDPPFLEKKRLILLRKAFSRLNAKDAAAVNAFAEKNAAWLDPYALFMTLKNIFGDTQWNEWPVVGLRLFKPDAVAAARVEYAVDVFFWQFVQCTAYTQWEAFRAELKTLGIRVVGDIPIYASFDSADVWADNSLFQLNTKHIPKRVGGVPPDYFNRSGQLWGNPLYNWDEMKKDGYAWWLSRIENALALYDVVRLDHFRGLYAYWAVPYANKTAKKGDWMKGPGMDLVRKIRARYPDMDFIMEDLGALDRQVKRFFTSSGYPGMRVMQFGFGGDAVHLTKNYPADCVAYTGTHDNNTILGWYGEASESAKAESLRELGLIRGEQNKTAADVIPGAEAQPADITGQFPMADEYLTGADGQLPGRDICRAWIESLYRSNANLVVVPIQDMLYQGAGARMNFPGTASPDNWSYRVTDELLAALDVDWIAGLNLETGRSESDPETGRSEHASPDGVIPAGG